MASTPLYLSLDIGTGSVRAALFTKTGEKITSTTHPIITRNKTLNHYEQSSNNIWQAIVICVRKACSVLNQVGNERLHVVALGIDATCSLVACKDDIHYSPLSVVAEQNHPAEDDIYNIMLWLDRRSIKEAEYINQMENEHVKQVRSHFGDTISPENEPPKLLWLQKHRPKVISCGIFFDLADWVAFKCCGNPNIRSSCTVACKWGWGTNNHPTGAWSRHFWQALGLSELCENNFHKIGCDIIKPGCSIGRLTLQAATELGLSVECIVASPMIDAHAGSLWSLGANSPITEEIAPSIEHRLSVIAGTSTCFIQVSKHALFVEGVWGPFRDAVMPDFHVTEGGQSVTGKLLENTVERHVCYPSLCKRVGVENVYKELAEMTECVMRQGGSDPAENVHCLDYHAGSRSPRPDPLLRGCIIGLTLAKDEMDLAVKFRATIQALCYGARHIVEEMRAAGHIPNIVTACGGLCKSRLFLTELADCLCTPVVLSSEEDTVLLGGAILARTAVHSSVGDEMKGGELVKMASEMTRVGEVIMPNAGRKAYHDRKYVVYKKMRADFLSYKAIMSGEVSINEKER